MKKDFIAKKRPSGSARVNEPGVATPPIPNTELCVDLKTQLRRDSIARMGKDYHGVLNRDKRYHYSFVETLTTSCNKHNPRIFEGEYFNITRRDDGSLRLNFRPLRMNTPDFNIDSFALGVCDELRLALNGLGGEE